MTTKAKTRKKPGATKATKPKSMSASPIAMGALAEGYLAHLEEAGKSAGTLFSYRQDILIAVKHFGAETDVATLTTPQVAEFFGSDAVMKTKTGRTKAKPTVEKTRRVLRLALGWAANSGLIAAAPIPRPLDKR